MRHPSTPDVLPASPRLFTLGYEGLSLHGFVNTLTTAGVDLVVDVRENPISRKPGFAKSGLRRAVESAGMRYQHARFAGNPKRLRDSAPTGQACLALYAAYLHEHTDVLRDLSALVEASGASGICFVCYERLPAECHRTVLLDAWQRHLRRTLPIVHLGAEVPAPD